MQQEEGRIIDRQLRIGFAGARRAHAFTGTFARHPATMVAAVCDVLPDKAQELAASFGAMVYHDYDKMLDEASLDAVVVATPMQFHAPQAIGALRRDIAVLSEVTAAVNLDEARRLAAAARGSQASYMLAENYCYGRENLFLGALVKAGLFGDIYFAEGEYLHELKGKNQATPWRRSWQTGVNGCTYGTHSLGPILQWLALQRVTAVSCVGSGHHYRDAQGDPFEIEDTVLMLCRLSGGGLAKIRLDMLSDRPAAATNYALQGTDGCYESARARGEPNRVWLRNAGAGGSWSRLEDYEQEFTPDEWKNPPADIDDYGHWGGDYFVAIDFIEVLLGQKPNPIDVDRAMDMTLPGLISQQSIGQGGVWLDVPDSRQWRDQ